jgi:hypothetical protein
MGNNKISIEQVVKEYNEIKKLPFDEQPWELSEKLKLWKTIFDEAGKGVDDAIQNVLWDEVEKMAHDIKFIRPTYNYFNESFNFNSFLKELKSKYRLIKK